MAVSNQFLGLDLGTLNDLKASFVECLKAIAIAGQNYTISGRTFTRADLAQVRQTIAEIQAAIDQTGSRAQGSRTYANLRPFR